METAQTSLVGDLWIHVRLNSQCHSRASQVPSQKLQRCRHNELKAWEELLVVPLLVMWRNEAPPRAKWSSPIGWMAWQEGYLKIQNPQHRAQ